MTEPVRLVIWDLDETFWRGTLTEGGITFLPENKEIVIELARRGIISSICSKNDIEAVKKILVEHEVWDYFVLPSVSWAPKGPRIHSLIETIGFRPPTVLFVDDNPSNLEEVRSFVPGIQLANETSIPTLLGDPLFKGKDDKNFSRLQQYKLLERRHQEMTESADTTEFLRSSNIRVVIDHDVEGNIERAIELINRTNQLNFTKNRLPEDLESAKSALRELLADYSVQAGLVRVYDRFGDYGYCGVYVNRKVVHAGSGLIHYCFSCRTLGMKVETWLYRRLGRPPIAVAGEVLSDITDETQIVDWIEVASKEPQHNNAPLNATKRSSDASRILVRGGCELMPVAHYLNLITDKVIGEYAFNRDHIQIRIEHSVFLRHALEGLTQEASESFQSLGFRPEDFTTRLFDSSSDRDVLLFSFWADAGISIYRHKTLGIRIPFNAFPAVVGVHDLTGYEEHQIDPRFKDHWIVPALRVLKTDYVFEGPIREALFKENFKTILSRVARTIQVFIIGCNEQHFDANGKKSVLSWRVDVNKWCRDLASSYPNVSLLDFASFIRDESDFDRRDPNHFHRLVYFRMYEEIAKRIDAGKEVAVA